MTTKDQLTERKTLVTVRDGARVPVGRYGEARPTTGEVIPAGTYIVKDLMQRAKWTVPDEIGIGPVDRGFAFAVKLADIELA